MRTIPVRVAVLALAAVQLGGCTSFLGIDLARHAKPEPPQASEPALAAAPVTEAARKQLAEGQTGLAVATFKQALAAGEPQAPAINGLGVAFARLGRFDLAHRFFTQAMAIDPAETRYADNLARMMRSPELLAMRRDADIAAAAQAKLAPGQAEAKTAQARAAAMPEVGKIERLSRGEVRIVTAPPQAQPTARTVQSASAEGFKPLIRVAFADPEAEQAKGFVRIVLPEPREAEPVKDAAVYGPKVVTVR